MSFYAQNENNYVYSLYSRYLLHDITYTNIYRSVHDPAYDPPTPPCGLQRPPHQYVGSRPQAPPLLTPLNAAGESFNLRQGYEHADLMITNKEVYSVALGLRSNTWRRQSTYRTRPTCNIPGSHTHLFLVPVKIWWTLPDKKITDS